MTESDALFRLPLIYQLDGCINNALGDFYNYYYIPGVIQDLIAVPVIFILVACTCIMITWRNQYLMTYYCSVLSLLCIVAALDTSLKSVYDQQTEAYRQLGYTSFVFYWAKVIFLLLAEGCILTMSYIANPLFGVSKRFAHPALNSFHRPCSTSFKR